MNSSISAKDQVFSVTQITEYIKGVLEATFNFVMIEGEISNWKPTSTGHIYFTLKDSNSQIKAVMFKGSAYHLTFTPKDGDKVRLTGNISVYAAQGNYQIIVTKMENVGKGNILQMLEERKRRLAAEGLFDSDKKKKIPVFPKTIGVVTSPSGAAIRDIINVSTRRNPNINIIVLPSLVQGEGADLTIAKMIEIANFYSLCDVLIIGRGGGSLEDLLPFSEETVVRAIANSKIPTISAVGHEIDWAISDFAADLRAPTPSAAAELAVPQISEIRNNINDYKTTLYNQINQKIENKRLLIKSFNIDNLLIRFRNIQQPLLNRFEIAKENLYQNLITKIQDLRTQINNNKNILEQASPQTILNRGYSMVQDENGNIIRSSKQITQGQKITIKPSQGKITATVVSAD